MSTRRHFGSIRKLPSGRYQAGYWHEGTRHNAPYTFKAKADAQVWLAGIETDITRQAWVDPAGGQLTVAELATCWLAANPGKRVNSRANDLVVIRVHLGPIATRRLGAVTPPDVQGLVNSWAGAPRSVRRRYSTLRAMFNYAVASDWLGRSPCRGIHLPAVTSTRRTKLSAEQVAGIAQHSDDRYQAMVWVGVVLGWRWEEVAGLRVGALDLLGSTVTVAETVIRDAKGTPVMSGPKSKAGQRTVAIPGELVEVLAEHLAARGLTAADADRLVFEAPGGGPLRYSNWLRRTWKPAVTAAGVPTAGFHDLRRANATQMVAGGVDVKTAAARFGHSDPRLMLSVYAEGVDEADRRAAETVGSVFLGRRPARASRTDNARRSAGTA